MGTRNEVLLCKQYDNIWILSNYKGFVDIPEGFTANKVEVLVLPVTNDSKIKKPFNPEEFFGVSHLENVDEQLKAMRDE